MLQTSRFLEVKVYGTIASTLSVRGGPLAACPPPKKRGVRRRKLHSQSALRRRLSNSKNTSKILVVVAEFGRTSCSSAGYARSCNARAQARMKYRKRYTRSSERYTPLCTVSDTQDRRADADRPHVTDTPV